MGPFWLIIALASAGTLMPRRLPGRQARWVWLLVGVVLAMFMGLRHEVGGDWVNHLTHFQDTAMLSFAEAISLGDPGYSAPNWLVAQLGGTICWVRG